jgi:hypothetical protein
MSTTVKRPAIQACVGHVSYQKICHVYVESIRKLFAVVTTITQAGPALKFVTSSTIVASIVAEKLVIRMIHQHIALARLR